MEMRRNVLRVGRAALSVFLSNDFLWFWLHHHVAEDDEMEILFCVCL
jgi:hypothetical protein